MVTKSAIKASRMKIIVIIDCRIVWSLQVNLSSSSQWFPYTLLLFTVLENSILNFLSETYSWEKIISGICYIGVESRESFKMWDWVISMIAQL